MEEVLLMALGGSQEILSFQQMEAAKAWALHKRRAKKEQIRDT